MGWSQLETVADLIKVVGCTCTIALDRVQGENLTRAIGDRCVAVIVVAIMTTTCTKCKRLRVVALFLLSLMLMLPVGGSQLISIVSTCLLFGSLWTLAAVQTKLRRVRSRQATRRVQVDFGQSDCSRPVWLLKFGIDSDLGQTHSGQVKPKRRYSNSDTQTDSRPLVLCLFFFSVVCLLERRLLAVSLLVVAASLLVILAGRLLLLLAVVSCRAWGLLSHCLVLASDRKGQARERNQDAKACCIWQHFGWLEFWHDETVGVTFAACLVQLQRPTESKPRKHHLKAMSVGHAGLATDHRLASNR